VVDPSLLTGSEAVKSQADRQQHPDTGGGPALGSCAAIYPRTSPVDDEFVIEKRGLTWFNHGIQLCGYS